MAEQFLPDNDSDLLLARRINEYRDAGRSLSGIDDPVVDLLLQYKEERKKTEQSHSIPSEALWKSIEQRIGPSTTSSEKKTTARIYRLDWTRKSAVWAVAASLLLFALAGLLYFNYLAGPQLIAESGSQVTEVTLSDGSNITLRPHSKLFALEENEELQLYRLTGEALFDVAEHPERTFSIETGNGRVSVLGTRFILSTWGTATRVFLETGSVQLETPDGSHALVLDPGEAASIMPGGEPVKIPSANSNEYTDWIDNELSFVNKSPDYVFRELEQHFNVTISVNQNIDDKRISGSLSLQDLQKALEDLELVLDGTFESTGERTYRFVPNN